MTLSGQGSQALVLNQTITLQNVSAGSAALRVQSQDVSCRQGEGTGATALQVDCTTVTDTGVTVVAQPGTAAGATPAAISTSTEVSCSGSSCTVHLSGAGSEALAFGQNITLTGVDSGTATLAVGGGREVACRQGDSRTEGQLQVSCAAVTTDAVTVTASLG